jgi:hypothetical protein
MLNHDNPRKSPFSANTEKLYYVGRQEATGGTPNCNLREYISVHNLTDGEQSSAMFSNENPAPAIDQARPRLFFLDHFCIILPI